MIMEYAALVSLLSAFSTGRDVKKNATLLDDIIELQQWLTESKSQDIVKAIEKSHGTSISIKALIRHGLPQIIGSINEVHQTVNDIPVTIETLLGHHSELLRQTISRLEEKRDISKHSTTTHQSSCGDQSPIPGYAAISGINLAREIPFDAGLHWGLERGSFTAIWGDRGGPDLLAQLQHVEELLQQRASGKIKNLQHRFWISVDLQAHRIPPTTMKELLEMASESDHQALPGVVIQIKSLELSMLRHLGEWCRALRERITHKQTLALIVVAPAHLAEHPRLSQEIDPQSGMIEILLAPHNVDLVIDSEISNHSDSVTPGPLGASHVAWIRALAAELKQAGTMSSSFKAMLDSLEDTIANPTSEPNVLEVVADLDALADSNMDRFLLETVAQQWPERIMSLVRAFALSKRSDARELPLTLTDSLSWRQRTLWLRAWIAGAIYLSEEDITTTLNRFLHGHTKLKQDLLLAAFRQAMRHPTCVHSKDLLDTFKKHIRPTSTLRTVFELGQFGFIEAGKIIGDWGADHFVPALCAGLHLIVRPGDLDTLTLNHPDPWWMLSASMPTADLIEAIAELDRDRRAVFGLLSVQERQKVAQDRYLITAIVECRRLPFVF